MFLQLLNTLLLISLLSANNLPLIDFFDLHGNIIPKQSTELPEAPQRIINNSLGIKTTAKSVLIIDETTETKLFEKNSQEVLPIASLTKLMTALVFLEHNPGWDKRVKIKESDQKNGGIVYLWPGEVVKVEDLFYLTLVASTNEATAALARSTALSQETFVKLMNEKAALLGLTQTRFVEPTGLDPNNQSTVTDLVKLAKAAFSKQEIVEATKLKGYRFKVLNKGITRYARSTNQLLDSFINNTEYKIEGAKTGYLEEVDYCQVIKVFKEEAGKSIIIAILGSQTTDDRWQEIKGLVDWAFDTYSWTK